MSNILLLGGYGNAGRAIARGILSHTATGVLTIAGRRREAAELFAQALRDEFPQRRIASRLVDAGSEAELVEAFRECSLVVNAASSIAHKECTVRALLATGADYLDTHLSAPPKLAILRAQDDRLREADICCITDGGFHPGLPAAAVRYAAGHFDHLQRARIYSAIRINWRRLSFSPATRQEMVDEFRHFQPLEFRNGEWRRRPYSQPLHYDFDAPFGRRYCVPMHLAEMEGLPSAFPGLQQAGFYVTGFNPLLDYLLMPVIALGARVLPRPLQGLLGRLLVWGLRRGGPPYGIQLDVNCAGLRHGRDRELVLRLSHPDAYHMTAAPVVACVKQLLEDPIRRPGLQYQALIVEPVQFIADLRAQGVAVELIWKKDGVKEAVR